MCESARAFIRLVCRLAVFLSLAPSALAAEPSELESELTMSIGGVEQTLTLQQAMDALKIQSVSLALIDQDRIAFTRAYGGASRRQRFTRRRHCRNSFPPSALCA